MDDSKSLVRSRYAVVNKSVQKIFVSLYNHIWLWHPSFPKLMMCHVRFLTSNFDDLYNVKHFINTLEGVVRIMGRLPEEARSIKQTIIQVPVRVTKTYIEEQIRSVFENSKVILLDIVLHSTKGVEKEKDTDIEATRCLVIHRSLQFLPQVSSHILTSLHHVALEASR